MEHLQLTERHLPYLPLDIANQFLAPIIIICI